MKIITVVGARPQFVKAAIVSRAFRATPGVNEILVHTGQHYSENLSDIFFTELEIPAPRYHLGVGSLPHGAQTGRMLEQVERVFLDERPDLILVYGDTNSTLAAAVAASKLHIPVAHVEAGLRSFNRRMPEEVNRVLTDHLSRWLFVPTEAGLTNLRQEGIAEASIYFVGDVMYDAARYYGAGQGDTLERYGLEAGGYVLATIHRAENTDHPTRLRNIVSGLGAVARECPVVLPIHPRTRNILERHGWLDSLAASLTLIEPVGYRDMTRLEKNARLIATDSGGVQKEAFFHRVPCVTLRDETEWVELVEVGWNRLLPPTDAIVVRETILAELEVTDRPAAPADLYGGGQATERIVEILAGSGRELALPANAA